MSYRPHVARASARAQISPWYLVGISAAALLCAIPQPAAAQELTEAQTTILKRITVVAQRSKKNVLDVPQTISVIDGKTIENHMVRDIQDLVRYEPGVSVPRTTSSVNPWGELNSFSIRGVGTNRVQMLVDGSRVAEWTQDGSRAFVDPWNMKAVEIIRGPNSVLWGSDALGGTVAFRTRDPADLLEGSDKPWAVELRTAWDSFDNSFRQQVTGAYDFGDVEVLASIGHLSAEEAKLSKADPDGGIWGCPRPAYFRCNVLFPADIEDYNGLLKGVWTPNADHTVTATAEFYSRHNTVDQVWDSSASATTGAPTTTLYNVDGYIRELDIKRTRLAIEHEWQVNADWLDSVKWNLSYTPQSRDTTTDIGRIYSDRRVDIEQLRNNNETFLEADLQLVSSFDAGSLGQHTLTYGFDGDFTVTDYLGSTYTTTDPNGPTPPTTVPSLEQGWNFPRVETVRADLYVQDEIELFDGKLTLTPGLRLANYSMDPTTDTSFPEEPTAPLQVIESTRLIKKLGAIYRLNDEYSVFAAYGEGFKMPTASQLYTTTVRSTPTSSTVIPNPNLKPESVQSYEAGFRGDFQNGYFTVSGFYADYKDFIRSFQPIPSTAPGVAFDYTYDNVESVQLWGVEFAGEYELTDQLTLTAGLTASQGRQKVSATSAETAFDGAVPLTTTLGFKYLFPEQNLELEVVGTLADGVKERSSPTAFKPEGYALLDAYLKWEPSENVEVTAGVQNIFDTRYFPNTLTGYATTATSSTAGSNPLELQTGPGRTFKLGAKVKF